MFLVLMFLFFVIISINFPFINIFLCAWQVESQYFFPFISINITFLDKYESINSVFCNLYYIVASMYHSFLVGKGRGGGDRCIILKILNFSNL